MSIKVRILGDDSDLQKTLGNSTKQLAQYGAAAAAAAGAAAAALTAQGLKAVDSQAKLARSLDTSIDSLKALQIAASDAGLNNLESSLKRLNRRLGHAELGMGAAGTSVKALGLNLNDLSNMDADDRIAAIADAVKNSGMSMQQAASHAQNLGFEQAQAAAFFQQGGDAIRSYKTEVAALGLSINEIDAAKVEMANDAFSRMGMITDGLQQQFAVESAPYLEAISETIKESITGMGGLGTVAENTFDFMLKASGFVGNAFRGFEVIIKALEVAFRGWGVVAAEINNKIVQGIDVVINGAKEGINNLIDMANKIPGVDLEKLVVGQSQFAKNMESAAGAMVGAFDQSVDEMHNLLMEPLPSESIKKWAEGVKQEAAIAAEAMLAAQAGGSGVEDETKKPGGMTDEEKAKIQERLEAIRQSHMTEVELINKKFEEENAIIDQAYQGRQEMDSEWGDLMAKQKQKQEAELTAVEKNASDAREALAEKEAQAKKAALSGALTDASTLMNSESKKMFKIGKAAALAQAIIDGQAAIVGAYKFGASLGGPPLGAAFGALAGAVTLQNINAIRSQSFGGGGGGGGGGGSSTQNINAQTQPVERRDQTVANISLVGDVFSRDSVKGLMEQMNELSDDGMRLRVT